MPVPDLMRPFPGGIYRITKDENERLCVAVGAVADDRLAHPIFFYIATQIGMGMTVSELCERCDFNVADGPMMTQSNATFERDLIIDENYDVAGEILSLTRRPSRSFGEVDLLRYRLTLSNGRDVAVTCINEWLLPRRSERAA